MRFHIAALAICLAYCASARAEPDALDPMKPIYACTQISDAADRLACFDREVGAVKSKQAEGAFTAIDTKTAETLQRESFGFSIPSLPRLKLPGGGSGALPEQVMTVAGVLSGGPLRITMTNGQVWRQVDADRNRGIKPGAEVVIQRAAFGSFLLTPKTGGIGVRVRREQ